ncbi:MAG: hypothetical protein QM731_25095 [Chitinophagaceae bacterium]
MKKIIPFLLLSILFVAKINAQTVTFPYTPTSCSAYDAPVLWTDGDSVYIEFTTHWQQAMDVNEDNNCWFAVYQSYNDLINYNPFLLKEEWFPGGGLPYSGTKTYRGAFYVGNLTTATTFEFEVGATFVYSGYYSGSSEVYLITYTP